MIRIAVSGSGGSGKTTLAASLARRLGLPCVDEGVHEWLLAERLAKPWDLSLNDQLRLQRYAIDHKRAHEVVSFVSDRTTVDAVSLLTLRLERLGASPPETMVDDALRHAHTAYDVALLLGPERVSSVPDEVALLDPSLRPREVQMSRARYESIGIPVLHIPPLPAPEMAQFALGALLSHRSVRPLTCAQLLGAAASIHLDASANALYLWGSVLTDDFVPLSSDVDAVLIGRGPLDGDAIDRFEQTARQSHELLAALDLSVIPLDEGDRQRSRRPLDRIHRDVLFEQVRAGTLIWGAQDILPRTAPPTVAQQLALRLAALRRRIALNAADAGAEPIKFILKELGFVCHLHHQLVDGEHPFSYEALRRHAAGVTREPVDALLEARANDWKSVDNARVRALAECFAESRSTSRDR